MCQCEPIPGISNEIEVCEREKKKREKKSACVCSPHPGVAADGLLAVFTGVGVEALVALHTVGVVLPENILLPKQGLLAVVAVVALCHPVSGTGPLCSTEKRERRRGGREGG